MSNQHLPNDVKAWPLHWILACILFVPLGLGIGVFLAHRQIVQDATKGRSGIGPKQVAAAFKHDDSGDKDDRRKAKRKRSGRVGRLIDAIEDVAKAVQKTPAK